MDGHLTPNTLSLFQYLTGSQDAQQLMCTFTQSGVEWQSCCRVLTKERDRVSRSVDGLRHLQPSDQHPQT
jgi:hypothetical protein